MLYLYCSPTHNSHRTQFIFNMKGRTNGKCHPSVKLLRMSDREAESGMEREKVPPQMVVHRLCQNQSLWWEDITLQTKINFNFFVYFHKPLVKSDLQNIKLQLWSTKSRNLFWNKACFVYPNHSKVCVWAFLQTAGALKSSRTIIRPCQSDEPVSWSSFRVRREHHPSVIWCMLSTPLAHPYVLRDDEWAVLMPVAGRSRRKRAQALTFQTQKWECMHKFCWSEEKMQTWNIRCESLFAVGVPSSVGEAGQTLKEVFIALRGLIIKGGWDYMKRLKSNYCLNSSYWQRDEQRGHKKCERGIRD